MKVMFVYFAFLTGTIFSGYANAAHFDDPGVCKDVYVWMWDGSVDCKFLTIESHWGIHTKARELCMTDPNTRCCITCKTLGFVRGGDNNTSEPTTTPAPTTPTVSTPPTTGDTYDHLRADKWIWAFDGDVDCKYLYTESSYLVHQRPEYYCLNYSMTDCCRTCASLGYMRGGCQIEVTEAPTATTSSLTSSEETTTTTTSATTAVPACRDIGIQTRRGMVSCEYLERRSRYDFHENPLRYCRDTKKTSCCETCARLAANPSQSD